MASTASPIVVNGGTNASMWAKEPGPNRPSRAAKSSEPGAASRGTGRGGPRGRGGRGRGGRPANGKGTTPSKPEVASSKSGANANQAQEKPSSDLPKSPVQPSSTAPADQTQGAPPSKGSSASKPARRGSEPKGQRRGPSLNVDASVTSASNPSSSPSVSPRTPSRRKRGNSKASQPSTVIPPSVQRKPSLSPENGILKEKAVPPPKDLPPHLAPLPPKHVATPFDIKHDIDALVERVRAVAMDRPHTPGSHIDWAGDDDDSLPDLDDWGVHPTAVSADTTSVSEESAASVISPILQDTLKPLPTLNDVDIPTPSIKLHEVHEDAKDGRAGDETPRETVPPSAVNPNIPTSTSRSDTDAKDTNVGSSVAPASTASRSVSGSSKPSRTPSPQKGYIGSVRNEGVSSPRHALPRSSLSDFPSKDSSPSPSDRSLNASIHAITPSASAPQYLGPRPPRGGFNPSHNRAHTVGRFNLEHHSDSDRPRRGDVFTHGRNHSTPPAGPGTVHAHTRAHTTRPVISVDAISRLARTLGGSPLPRREKEAAAAVKSD